MEKPLVSIIVPTYNRVSSLRNYCFPGIASLTYPNYEVIVVDNCSTDDTLSFLKTCEAKIENLVVLRNPYNKGLCFSKNRGAANAKGEIIVFTDDDATLFPDCLDELVKVYEDPDVMAAWGCIYQYGSSLPDGTPTSGTGSLMSCRRVVFKRFRFDTNLQYFKSYACDEHEFMRRLQKDGLKIVHAERAKADHFHAPSKERSWRGLGGDLNFLYETLRLGSITQYYMSFFIGILLLAKSLFQKSEFHEQTRQYRYRQAVETPHRLLVFIKKRQFSIAAKWLFYTFIDIPLRAKTKEFFESIARNYSRTWPV